MHPNPHTQPDAPTNPLWVPDPRISAFGAPNGAKYKMMSPAKLPISRSPCLTVPPGLSPGALLESPVLLTNIKAEPSPTTGSFLHSFVNGTVSSNSTCSPRGTYRNSAHDDGNSSDFEFKPHIRMSSCPGFSSVGHLAAVNPTQQEREFCRHIQRQPQIHILDSSHIVQAENTTPSRELTLSVTTSDPPIETSPLEANVPGEVALDELQQTMGSDNGTQALQCDNNESSPSTAVEKSSEDGFNWRKYGQKQVKGSVFPRSYYKCTHPNCQMKKQLERSHDGQITEIIYKGQHDHPKPEPSRRLAVGAILSGQGEERCDRHSLASAEEKLSNAHQMDPNGNSELSPISPSDDAPETGVGSNRNGYEVADDDDPESKRRKLDNDTFDASQIGKTNREPRVVVQTISEVDILDDGYRWRKYGQKVVKGNPNPRSYYKCTSVGCSVRKHVERASHDPKAVITTYEGKHNHDVPAARNSSHDTAAPIMSNGGGPLNNHMPTAMSGMLRTTYDSVSMSHHYSRPEETDMITLGLGVGINANQKDCTATEKLQQTPGFGRSHSHEMQQFPSSVGNKVVAQATPLSIFYGSSGNDLYGSKDDNAGGFAFRTPPVNHSSKHYYPSSGNLVMGP